MLRILVEDDPYLRILPAILDPRAPRDHKRAIADFMRHDVPDFEAWCRTIREEVQILYPAEIERVSTQDQLKAALPRADAAIVETLRIGEEELAAGSNLAIVQKFGTVLSNIDVGLCAKRNVAVAIQRRRVNIAVAEHGFALMIALAKRLCETDGLVEEKALREAGFDPTPYDRRYTTNSNFARIPKLKTLNGSVLGAVGAGEIGREFIRRASAFGMEVLYHQRHPMSAEDEAALAARYVPLRALLERADFVALNLPLNAATEGIFNSDTLAACKPGVIVVNTARAALVERKALMAALDSGRIGGYGLDVGYKEPADPGEPLLKYRNVILTPHTAIAGRENGLKDLADMFRNIAHAIEGRRR